MIDASKKQEKMKIIDASISTIEKQFGKGSVMIGNTKLEVPILCSTGSIKLDLAIGVGGIPEGRISEIYGPESSGKTTMALIQIANVQRAGGTAAFVDAEHALDPIWATHNGVNMQELLLSQPDSGEEALQICQNLIEGAGVDYIVVDSVAALVPRSELEGEIGDSHMALQARLMSQALRILTAKIAKTRCHLAFINQVRSSIGGYGNPEVTTGGNALKFYSTIRMEVRKTDVQKDKDGIEGQSSVKMKVKIVKNKVATPFKIVELDLNTGNNGLYGFDTYAEILDLAVDNNIIKKAGSWFSFGEERLGQGKDNILTMLRSNDQFFNTIKTQVLSIMEQKNESIIGSFSSVTEVVNEEVKKKRRKKNDDVSDNLEEVNIVPESVEENTEQGDE